MSASGAIPVSPVFSRKSAFFIFLFPFFGYIITLSYHPQGGHMMKKYLLSILVVVVVMFACGATALAVEEDFYA